MGKYHCFIAAIIDGDIYAAAPINYKNYQDPESHKYGIVYDDLYILELAKKCI